MITIGYSTRVSNPEYKKYLQKTCMFKEVEIIEKVNNGEKSLSEVYNEIIEESTNDIIVLCHDDIEFDTKNWGEKLLKNFDKTDYGILGLAGSTSLSESGTWWETPLTMRGIVNHKKDGNKWESKYSINDGKISNTLLIDGLFIAFNKRKIVHKFDESVEGFHFYDLTFSFSNFLKGVKIGVTYDVRVTHLSIGETNEQWEKNKISFIEKFKTELPKKLIEPIDITTFIICHDESIIKNNIQSKKFNSLGDVKFLYVGKNEFDDINLYPNVIIVRDLKYNIEQYPRFTAFTAWYAIWKNNLCTTKYLNLLEYDVNLNEDFNFYLSNVIKMKPKIVSYFPLTMRNYHYINNPDWVTSITKGIKLAYKTDIRNFVTGIIIDSINKNVEPIWPTTNNVCFEYTTFEKYMKWIQPLISYMKDDPYSGHNQERALSFFSLMNKVPVAYFQGYIEHVQSDSHKTQGHEVIKELIK